MPGGEVPLDVLLDRGPHVLRAQIRRVRRHDVVAAREHFDHRYALGTRLAEEGGAEVAAPGVRIEVLADALDCALLPCFVARYADWELPLDRLAVLRPERLLFRRRQRLPELSI